MKLDEGYFFLDKGGYGRVERCDIRRMNHWWNGAKVRPYQVSAESNDDWKDE